MYEGGWVVGQLPGGVVDDESAVTVGRQCADLKSVRGHDRKVRAVLARQAGDGALARPAAEQDVERIVGAGGEDDVVAGHPGQRADGCASRIEDGRGGLGGDIPADLGFVSGMLGGGVDDGEALPRTRSAVEV